MSPWSANIAKLGQICSKCDSASSPSYLIEDIASLRTTDFQTEIYSLGQSKNANAKPWTLTFKPKLLNPKIKHSNQMMKQWPSKENIQPNTFRAWFPNLTVIRKCSQTPITNQAPCYTKLQSLFPRPGPKPHTLKTLHLRLNPNPPLPLQPRNLERWSRSWWSDLTRSRAWCPDSGGWSPRRQPGSSDSWAGWGTPCTWPRPLP